MMVFFNMIDIAAINSLNIWLDQNLKWKIGKKFVQRRFLEELNKSLINAHNQRRAEEIPLAFKVKHALQSLGYQHT